MLKNKQFSYNLDYHLYDFGTGQDIDLYDDEKSLSQKEWNAMFEQGVPTINTKNPIVFTADIEAVPLPVNKTIEFVIPGTERKLVIDVDSTRKNCLVDIFVSPWVDENRLVLRVEYEDGQIDNACITMNSQIFATIDKEHPNKSDVEDWLNQLTAHKTFIEWIVNQTQWSIEDVSLLPDDVENIWISKPITLSESNTAQVTINIGRMNKTYVVKLAKPLDVDYLKAIVEFPVNDDDFVVSLRPSTQVKCTSGFTLSEHIAVPETTQLGSILKSGVKEARTALNKHNQ